MSDALLAHHTFTPLIGEHFRLAVNGTTIALRLAEVTPLPPLRRRNDAGERVAAADVAARSEPFSLLFTGPLTHPLPQRTYRLTHAAIAEPLDIFLVPVGRERDGFIYQAVFG